MFDGIQLDSQRQMMDTTKLGQRVIDWKYELYLGNFLNMHNDVMVEQWKKLWIGR